MGLATPGRLGQDGEGGAGGAFPGEAPGALDATAAELEKKGVKDFQLDYAVKALKRLASGPGGGAAKAR